MLPRCRPGLSVSALLAVAAAMLVPGEVASGADPLFGPRVRIDTGGNAQANETTIAAVRVPDGSLYDRIVAGWNDYREPGLIRTAFARSFDGGSIWVDSFVRPPAPHGNSIEGDPMTAYDWHTGTLWAGGISFQPNGGIYVARLDPGDTEFQPAVMAYVGAADKGWMAAGTCPMAVGTCPDEPGSTRLYLAFNLGIIWSDDLGETWTAPLPIGAGLGHLPRVGPNGEVYVAYWDYDTGVKLARRLDAGASFTTHTIATRMDVWGTQNGDRFPGVFRVPPLSYLAVHPLNGTLYAVYFDTTDVSNGQSNVDLYFTRSVDKGTTWTFPEVIDSGGAPTGDQFFPWLEVDLDGRIHVVFMDSRNVAQTDDAPPGLFDIYFSFSNDNGETWRENRLTDTSWSSHGVNFIGDYLGLAVEGNRVYPANMDTSLGDQNIFAQAIEFSCLWDCGDQNGMVDIIDFFALFSQWGQTGLCDFDVDGRIDFGDMIDLFANWGPCP